MNTITHNVDHWFKETYDTEISSALDFYNKRFTRRKLDEFKVQYSFAARFETDDKLKVLFSSICQGYIDLVVKMKPILKMVPFAMLEQEDREMLREFVCAQTEFAAYNQQIIEMTNQSNLSSSSFSLNSAPTGWVFTSDMLSKNGTAILQNSALDEYEIVNQKTLFTYSDNYNIVVLKTIEIDDKVPAIVWDTK